MAKAWTCGVALIGLAAGCTALNPLYGDADRGGSGTGSGGSDSTSSGAETSSAVGGTDGGEGGSTTQDAETTGTSEEGSSSGGLACPDGFASNFDGDQAWSDVHGYWTPDDGAMVAPVCEPLLSFFRYEGGAWDDAAVVMEFSIDEICPSVNSDPYRGVGMLTRMNPVDSCDGLDAIFCLADYQSNRLILGMADGACNGMMNENDDLHPEPPLELGTSYVMRMEVFGDEAGCSLEQPDGSVAKVTLMDTSLVESPGTVAFYAENAAATVESISVCPG